MKYNENNEITAEPSSEITIHLPLLRNISMVSTEIQKKIKMDKRIRIMDSISLSTKLDSFVGKMSDCNTNISIIMVVVMLETGQNKIYLVLIISLIL